METINHVSSLALSPTTRFMVIVMTQLFSHLILTYCGYYNDAMVDT